MKRGVFFTALMLGACCLCSTASAASADYDADANGALNALDAALLKQTALSGEAAPDAKPLLRYLVRDGSLSDEGDEPVWILEEKGTFHDGEATFYGGGYEGGCCMLDPISPEDYLVVAMNLSDYNNAMLAGAYIEAYGRRGVVHLLVTDLLPEGKVVDLDLNTDAFPLLDDPIYGRVPVTWRIVALPTDEPVSYKFKEGSSAFWCSVQVRNHRYPIAKLEYLNEAGEFVELPRRHYNFFESQDMGAGPYTFRVTDIYGDRFVDEDIPLTPDGITPGKGQFPE